MKKIGGFINPWGNGHFTRMMALDDVIRKNVEDDLDIHYSSSGEIYQSSSKDFLQKGKSSQYNNSYAH